MKQTLSSIQIFKSGTHRAMNGSVIHFAEDVVRGIANNYNPDISETPLVVGHPEVNAPAYGWVSSLSYADDVLSANTS